MSHDPLELEEEIIGFPTKEYIEGKWKSRKGKHDDYTFKRGLVTVNNISGDKVWCKNIKNLKYEGCKIMSDSDLVLFISRSKEEWLRSYLKTQLKMEDRLEKIKKALEKGYHEYV